MQVQFLLGRAGTGKTHACLEEIRRRLEREPHGPPLLFLVPEQATFQMERALLTGGAARATHRAHVVSFRRLAYRLLQQAGSGSRPRIGSLGKLMALTALLQARRDRLTAFARSGRQPGFAQQLADAVREFRAWRVRPHQLEQAAPDDGPLKDKLHDLALLYRDYESYLEGRFADPDRALDDAADLIPSSPWLRGAQLWVDGFAGFTGQEFHMLRALWRAAASTTIALCLDPDDLKGEPGPADLFAPTRDTYDRLVRCAREDGVRLLPPRALRPTRPPRFLASPALAHLESHLFRPGARPFAGREGDRPEDAIALVAAADPATEVEAAAREIVRLCRERGWRFRDISVILRDMPAYEHLIASVFAEHGIPYFIDRRRPLSHHPLVELLRSALETYVTGWAPEPVFRCLRTDLIPADRDEVDRLENYVLARGIRGRAWRDDDPWPPLADGSEADIDPVRRRVAEPLAACCRRLDDAEHVGDVVDALWGLLEDVGAAATLARWAEEAQAAGRIEEAREHGGAWDGVVQVLEEMDRALGHVPLDPAACLPVLEAGLAALTVGIIPPTLDQVLVGSAERSRQPDIRAAFILGAADGRFPPTPQEDVLLSDREREALQDRIELGPTSRTRLLHEHYMTYIALTRASTFLWISYPTADQDGKALAPSPFIAGLRRLFPGLAVRTVGVDPADDGDALARITHPDQLAAALAQRLRRHREGQPASPLWWNVYGAVAGTPGLRNRALPLLAALDASNAAGPLPPSLARRLFGTPMVTSPSRLERFAACPFQHFAAVGLGLEEPEDPGWDRAEVGRIIHGALRRFADELARDGVAWSTLSDDEAVRRADRCIDGLLEQAGGAAVAGPRHAFAARLLRDGFRRAVLRLTEHARRSRFQPVALEIPFGARQPGALPDLAIPLPDGSPMTVRGRIDRVDGATDDSGRYWVRIIDYKSRALTVDPARVFHGLDLQLPLYAAAVLEGMSAPGGGPVRLAGCLYFSARDELDPRRTRPAGGEDDAGADPRLKMQGLLIDDPEVLQLMDTHLSPGGMSPLIPAGLTSRGVHGFSHTAGPERWQALLDVARRRASQFGAAILAGRIDVRPYRLGRESPCRYCSFRSVCRFDPSMAGNGTNRLPQWKRTEAWERIVQEWEATEGEGAAAGPDPTEQGHDGEGAPR